MKNGPPCDVRITSTIIDIAAASLPTSQVRQFGWHRKFPNSTAKIYLTPVFSEKTPIEHNEKDGARTPPRAPNFNVHIHAQAAVYKTGRLFGNGSHSPGSNAPNFEIGAQGFGQLQPAFEMGVFCENHGTPSKVCLERS